MSSFTPYRTVFTLAAAQLRHEWVLTACLVAALAAVLAPLLVLLGLKEGTIETLRLRLVEDPVYREIRPAATQNYAEAWFDQLHGDPRIAFVIPTILPASSVIQIGDKSSELFDLIPSAAGDPLLLENGGETPGPNQCVLTHAAAQRLNVARGDTISARITRGRGGSKEIVMAQLQVAAVLDPRAGGLPRVYAPLGFLLDVESYKEGRAVPKRGWSGDSPRPHLSYQGALVITPGALDPITRTGLAVNTGLLRIEEITADALSRTWGIKLPEGHVAYRLWVPKGSVTTDSIRALGRKLRGRNAIILPDAGPLYLNIHNKPHLISGISLADDQAERLQLPNLPWGRWTPDKLDQQRLSQLLGDFSPSQDIIQATFDGAAPLRFPITRYAGHADEPLIVPAELTGLLRTAMEREVLYHPEQGFITALPGYRGFRLYARSIDDVPELVDELRKQGVEVLAEVEAIQRIRTLDQGLARLFRLIALLSIIGGAAVLVASLYASVERERKNLGILRLIGLARSHVFFYPLFQGLLIALFGVLFALLGYIGLASLINQSFSLEIAPDAQVCSLPTQYAFVALIMTLLLALASSLVAAWRATRIEPAEAIREE